MTPFVSGVKMETIIGGDGFIPQVFTSDIDLRRENITTMGSSTTITPGKDYTDYNVQVNESRMIKISKF